MLENLEKVITYSGLVQIACFAGSMRWGQFKFGFRGGNRSGSTFVKLAVPLMLTEIGQRANVQNEIGAEKHDAVATYRWSRTQ
jgi:hypothetical protein